MKQSRIVVIEDEEDIRDVIEYNLTREGFRVFPAPDGVEGIRQVGKRNPDLILLDLMLPGMDGLDVCRHLKGDPLTRPIPIVMVTAKGEERDIVLGLELGADDYVAKPFSPKELTARIKAVLRRGRLREEIGRGERIVLKDLTIDAARHEVTVVKNKVTFTPTEFRLLHFLASHPGRVFTRDHLLTRVLGEDAMVIDRNIDVHIRAVRKKIGDLRDRIETIRGVGYRFKEEIK